MTTPAPATPGRERLARETFTLRGDDGWTIRGDAVLAPGATTGVVLCHGFEGFGRWGFFPYVAERLACAGLNALTFDFSGSGVGADRETFTELHAFAGNTYTRELRDIAAVEAEGTRRGWLGDRYGLFGHSRGGGMAVLYAASSPRVGALATWAAIAEVGRWPRQDVRRWRELGYTELRDVYSGRPLRLGTAVLDEAEAMKRSTLDIVAAAGRVRVPWLIVHGTRDTAVPLTDAARLHDAAPTSRLLVLPHASHTFGVRHPMAEPSAALRQATAATVDLFSATLGTMLGPSRR